MIDFMLIEKLKRDDKWPIVMIEVDGLPQQLTVANTVGFEGIAGLHGTALEQGSCFVINQIEAAPNCFVAREQFIHLLPPRQSEPNRKRRILL